MLMLTSGGNIELQNELLTIVLHDIQSPLRFIATITQELALNCLKMDKKTLQEYVTVVNNSVVALQHYCTKINTWGKAKNKNPNTEIPQKINEVFIDVKTLYSSLIAFKKLEFNVVETDLYCFVNKEILFLIILNLIDNAYKNTIKGGITLEAFKKNNIVSIVVSDTGKGMQQKTIDEIIKNKYELNHSSLGYYIINDLLKKINGSIKIDSDQYFGTKITISLSNPEKFDSAYQGS